MNRRRVYLPNVAVVICIIVDVKFCVRIFTRERDGVALNDNAVAVADFVARFVRAGYYRILGVLDGDFS